MTQETKAGLGGKLRSVALGSYGWSSHLMSQLVGEPVALRRVNPALAGGLELLGFVGLLGLGRMYAGDISGGVRSLLLWIAACFGFLSAFALGAMLALVAAIPTLGISVGVFGLAVIPIMIPFLLTPFLSAGKLYRDLSRV